MSMWIWFGLGILFLGIEMLSFGLVSVWFACGAFVAIFFSSFSLSSQIYIFISVSALSLIFIRRVAMKYMKGRSKELDRITGKDVKIEKIQLRGEIPIYSVRLDGKYWEAISSDQLNIGEIAEVEKIEGNKLVLIKNI